MTLTAYLLSLLKAFRRFSTNRLTRCCNYLWTLFWRFICKFRSIVIKRCSFSSQPPPRSSTEPSSVAEIAAQKEGGYTQILASSVPSDVPLPARLHSTSETSLASDGGEYGFNTVPASDDDERSTWSSCPSNENPLMGYSMTFHSSNEMASQTLDLTTKNGSRIYTVHPASKRLQSGSIASLGGSSTDSILRHIKPMMPKNIGRYNRERYITNTDGMGVVDRLQGSFSLGPLPEGWEQITHPEGAPYFYHASKRIATDCWILDPSVYQSLAKFISIIDDYTGSRGVSQADDAYLVLEIKDGENWCEYYYASACDRKLFWLQLFDISGHVSDVRGTLSQTHIRLFLETQYWYHWSYFPHIHHATQETCDLMANTITDALTDVQTSNSSTVNYSVAELKDMADVVESAGKRRGSNSNWYIGRFMSQIMMNRFLNFHGQYGARLDHSQSIYGNKAHKQTWLIKIFSPLLFSAPNVHLKNLNDLWIDGLTLKPRCRALFIKLNGQWGEHIVHASILLTANVAFLAIPSVDPSNNSNTLLAARTSAQIVSYLSVITSYASMMLGLLLVRNHKAKELVTENVNAYHNYLTSHHKKKRGFEDLAIIYSLPYALLTWAMATFFVAFVLMCLVTSTPTVRSIMSLSTFIICGFIAWSIWMFWEETELQWRPCVKKIIPQKKLDRLKQLRHFLTGKKESSEAEEGLQRDSTGTMRDDAPASSIDATANQVDVAMNQVSSSRVFSIERWRGRWVSGKVISSSSSA